MKDISFLKEKAKEIRKSIVSMIAEAKSGHPGGSLSATDILTALYFSELNVDPAIQKWKEEIDLFFQKDMLLLLYMQLWLKKDIFQKMN